MPCASSSDSPYSTNGLRITLPKPCTPGCVNRASTGGPASVIATATSLAVSALLLGLPMTSRSIPQLMPDGSSPSGGTDCLSGDMVRAIALPARPAAPRRPSDHQLSRGRATGLGPDSARFLAVVSAENHEGNTGDTIADTGARETGAWALACSVRPSSAVPAMTIAENIL